ncbi:MAG: hypothetical protein JXP73_03480 [Deltaproteobacteria bacterium]|nr:hypothetical protein [Deltaproteobacteria bacterium]
MSLAAYALVACRPRSAAGAEGALKYFLMGALATGCFVYGMALIYGTTGGELSLPGIAGRAAQAGQNPLFTVGVLLILAALLFKVAAVPFHMWLPDAYEGAPTPVTGFMAAAIKAAASGGGRRRVALATGRVVGEPLAIPAVVVDGAWYEVGRGPDRERRTAGAVWW